MTLDKQNLVILIELRRSTLILDFIQYIDGTVFKSANLNVLLLRYTFQIERKFVQNHASN